MRLIPAILLVVLLAAGTTPGQVAAADTAANLRSRGLQALERGEVEEAIRLLSDSISANPEDYRSYNDRGVAYKRAGKPDQALEDYTRALEIKPDFVNALNNRGVIHTERGNYRKAIEDFTEGLKYGELQTKLYTNRGIVYALLGQHLKAVEDFREALSHSPLDYRSFLYMGDSLVHLGERDKALRMYQLASGLVTDPKASALVENRIADLEKALPSAESPAAANRNRTAAEAKNHLGNGTEPSPQSTRKAGLHTDKTKPSKPAAPVGIGASLRAIVPRVVVAGIESHTALDDAARTRVLEKLSPEATELYQVGLEYLEKSETRKAQLRFEDALQIARRNRNPLGEGWLLLEIGRTQADLGDHVRALHSFERSLSIFNRLKATDETILSLIEMGFSSKAGGLNQKAASFYAKARDSAASSGNQKLAEVLGRTLGPQTPKPDQAKIAAAPSAEAAKEPIKEPGRKVTHDPKEKKEQASSAAEVKSRGLEEVGRGPLEWATSDKGKKKAQTVANLPAFKPPTTSRLAPPTGPRESEQPRTNNDANRQPSTVTRREQDPSFVTASVPTRPTIEADLAALRRLRKSRDETKMIDVLERLANGYQQTSQHEQALLCLSAALALREKRAGKGGMEDLLLKRGLILERLGRTAPAIEDYTRCMALARVEGKQALRESASLRASQLAQKMNLDSKALMAALGRLWKARIEGDEQSETRAFHQVGALYQAAGMLSEAVNYYERAAASMAVQKAWLLEKMGKKEQADQLRSEAVGAFKKLDYSRYLRMIKKPESISRP